jgi:hypothetical protein
MLMQSWEEKATPTASLDIPLLNRVHALGKALGHSRVAFFTA